MAGTSSTSKTDGGTAASVDQSKSTPASQQDGAPQTDENKDQAVNPGTASSEAYTTNDQALGESAGLSEGEVHALRDDAGLNQGPGHTSDVHAWALSPAGKAWAEGEKDREKAAKDEAKKYEDQFDKDGMSEAEVKYVEAAKG